MGQSAAVPRADKLRSMQPAPACGTRVAPRAWEPPSRDPFLRPVEAGGVFSLSGIRCWRMSQRRRQMLEISPITPLPTPPHPSPTLFRRRQNSSTTLTPRPTAVDPTADHLLGASETTHFQLPDHRIPTRFRHSNRRSYRLPQSIKNPYFLGFLHSEYRLIETDVHSSCGFVS